MKISQISDKQYFAIEAFSNSGGGKLSATYTPKHYKANNFTGSSATRIGTAVHARMLNDVWDDEIMVYNGTKTLTSKAAAEFISEHPGKVVITQEESYAAKAIVENQDEDFLAFFRSTTNELAIVGDMDNIPVKCKIDAYSEKMRTIYDVKTTADMGKFQRNFYELGYHRQAAWYLKLAKLAGLEVDKFMFYVIESSAPYCSRFVSISDEVLEDGEEDIEEAFQIYKQCYLKDDWSEGFSDDVLEIRRPYWLRNKKNGGT